MQGFNHGGPSLVVITHFETVNLLIHYMTSARIVARNLMASYCTDTTPL